jgi:hypothetical protein
MGHNKGMMQKLKNESIDIKFAVLLHKIKTFCVAKRGRRIF